MRDIKNRFWELDSLRGIAIIVMIIFHIFYDLYYFGISNIKLQSYPIFFLFLPFAMIFLFLVGISLTLSYNKAKKTLSEKEIFIKFIIRGLKIFGFGLLVTIITFFYLIKGFVIFGVLHCIGISIILSYPFVKQKFFSLFFGFILIILGLILNNFSFDFSYLVWLGFIPNNFYTIDYFPLLPWFGIVLFGIFVGNMLYPNSKRNFNIPDLSNNILVRFLSFLGRNSLLIYLIHQPIIILIINLFLL